MDMEEPSSIGHGDVVGHNSILQWAKVLYARNYALFCSASLFVDLLCDLMLPPGKKIWISASCLPVLPVAVSVQGFIT
jgi:hypothetical protein